MIFRFLTLLATVLSLVASQPAFAQESAAWSALDREDLRLARIAERLMVANASLCNSLMPATGMILHSADQYRDGVADARFIDGPVALSGIVPHSPAARAGLQRDDAIVAIGEQSMSALVPPEDGNLREAAFSVLADQPIDTPVTLRIARNGVEQTLALTAPAGCRSLVEILVREGPRARSDGRVIQLQYDFAIQLDDDQMAVVLAHELAHTVLEHRRRKEEAGIDNGLFAEFGRNQQANRQAEVEADRLSAHLLANAGFDPTSIPAFWRSEIGRRLGGAMPSFVYPSQEARAELVEREMEMFLPQRRGPSWPGHLLALRERGFAAD